MMVEKKNVEKFSCSAVIPSWCRLQLGKRFPGSTRKGKSIFLRDIFLWYKLVQFMVFNDINGEK